MNKLGQLISSAMLIGAIVAALPACQKPEGPAERAGKSVDNAADKVGQKIENAGEKIQDAAKRDKN